MRLSVIDKKCKQPLGWADELTGHLVAVWAVVKKEEELWGLGI